MRNYGLKLDPIQIEKDYVEGGFGSLGGLQLQPSGQWDDFLPVIEFQSTPSVETMACTVFGTLNAVEILLKRKYQEQNFSDRWLAWNVGITEEGGSPQRAAETLRKAGVPLQEKWDFSPDVQTWEDFYKNPPTSLFQDARSDFLDLYTFKHSYVPTSEQSLKDSLKLSPLGVSVAAWFKDKDVFFKPQGMADNHWCVLYGDDEEAWHIFDSYDNTRKRYSKKANIQQAKRYSIIKRTKQMSFIERLLSFL